MGVDVAANISAVKDVLLNRWRQYVQEKGYYNSSQDVPGFMNYYQIEREDLDLAF